MKALLLRWLTPTPTLNAGRHCRLPVELLAMGDVLAVDGARVVLVKRGGRGVTVRTDRDVRQMAPGCRVVIRNPF